MTNLRKILFHISFVFQIYEVYLNTGEKPDIVENVYEFKTTMQRDANYTLEDGHKLLIKSSSFGSTGKIWIGLKPILGKI